MLLFKNDWVQGWVSYTCWKKFAECFKSEYKFQIDNSVHHFLFDNYNNLWLKCDSFVMTREHLKTTALLPESVGFHMYFARKCVALSSMTKPYESVTFWGSIRYFSKVFVRSIFSYMVWGTRLNSYRTHFIHCTVVFWYPEMLSGASRKPISVVEKTGNTWTFPKVQILSDPETQWISKYPLIFPIQPRKRIDKTSSFWGGYHRLDLELIQNGELSRLYCL